MDDAREVREEERCRLGKEERRDPVDSWPNYEAAWSRITLSFEGGDDGGEYAVDGEELAGATGVDCRMTYFAN